MPDRLFIPASITTTREAQQFIGVTPGSTVYLTVTCGDYDREAQKSVTVLPGQEGVVDEVYISQDIWWMVRIRLIKPLAQPFWCCKLESFSDMWTMDKTVVPVPEILTGLERVVLDRLGPLID